MFIVISSRDKSYVDYGTATAKHLEKATINNYIVKNIGFFLERFKQEIFAECLLSTDTTRKINNFIEFHQSSSKMYNIGASTSDTATKADTSQEEGEDNLETTVVDVAPKRRRRNGATKDRED